MRTRLFLFTVLLSSPLILFSQDEIGIPKLKPSGTYWGIGYYASGSIGLSNGYVNEGAVQPGYGGTIEITHNASKSTAVLMIGKNIIFSRYGGEHFDAVEFSLGPRIYFQKKSGQFGELTIGGIMVRQTVDNIIIGYNYYPDFFSNPEFDFLITEVAAINQRSMNAHESIGFKMIDSYEEDGINWNIMLWDWT